MNFFEIINKVLIELNYSPVATFKDLTSLEHKRLMDIINRLNKDICNLNNNFTFRQMIKKIQLNPNKVEYKIPFVGKVSKVVGKNVVYEFEPDYTRFYYGNVGVNTYSFYGEKLLFSPSSEEIKIFYSTDEFVKTRNDELKSDFEEETDMSIIPDNFVEKLFINGVAYNFKQNVSHPKYNHWKQEYDKAISALLAYCKKNASSKVIIDGGYRKL